jgi:hypothetical protein
VTRSTVLDDRRQPIVAPCPARSHGISSVGPGADVE